MLSLSECLANLLRLCCELNCKLFKHLLVTKASVVQNQFKYSEPVLPPPPNNHRQDAGEVYSALHSAL